MGCAGKQSLDLEFLIGLQLVNDRSAISKGSPALLQPLLLAAAALVVTVLGAEHAYDTEEHCDKPTITPVKAPSAYCLSPKIAHLIVPYDFRMIPQSLRPPS